MEKKIDVMIVGAQKAGTTSLLRYLSEHPECVGHPQKEFAYFVDIAEYGNNYSKAFNKYYSGQPISENTRIIAKSAGLYVNENAIKRLAEHNPKCEIIFILRNPVERAYSSYLMEQNYGNAKFEFSELPELIKKHQDNDESWGYSFFIDYGLYANYLKVLHKYFPEEQVNVILYRDFKSSPLSLCEEIFKKIGINSSFIPNTEVKHNVTNKTRSKTFARAVKHVLRKNGRIRNFLVRLIPTNKAYKYGEMLRNVNKTGQKHSGMKSSVRQFLINFYKPHNDELEKIINKNLSDWNE